jgi:hypothetical protein
MPEIQAHLIVGLSVAVKHPCQIFCLNEFCSQVERQSGLFVTCLLEIPAVTAMIRMHIDSLACFGPTLYQADTPLYTDRLFQIVAQKAGWVKGTSVDKKTLQGALKKLQAST